MFFFFFLGGQDIFNKGIFSAADVVITSSSHTPLRRADSGDFHSLRTGDLERPIGFAPEVIRRTSQSDAGSAPNPPYPVENFMPTPSTNLRLPSPSHQATPRDDINPPSYEQVMSNEAYYHHPPRN